MRVGVAGVPGAWSSERMREALEEQDVESFVFSLGDCLHDLNSGKVTLNGTDLGGLDGIVVKKLAPQDSAEARLRLHLLRSLEGRGVRVFSPAGVIDRAMDRYGMNSALAAAGLPLPQTFSFESASDLQVLLGELGEAVIKPVYTSKGRGMLRIAAGEDLSESDWDEGGRWLAQRFVEAPGRDIGACVLGGEFVGAFYRVAPEGQWMTTTARGGRYAPCTLLPRGQEIAVQAARLFDLDYTVVDLVENGDGFFLYEVSAFGGFSGLRAADGLDVASLYAAFVRKELSR